MESIGELKSEIGQLTIPGILIAQDLALVPMILVLRNYGNHGSFQYPIKLLASIGLIVVLIRYLSQKTKGCDFR